MLNPARATAGFIGSRPLLYKVLFAGVLITALTIIALAGAEIARAQEQPCSGPACAAENAQDFNEDQDARENSGRCEGRNDYSQECTESVEGSGEGSSEGGSGFAETQEPAYKTYPLTNYQFGFYVADEGSWFFDRDQKAANAVAGTFNGFASGLFVWYVIFMKGAVTVLEWVLTLDLVGTLNQTISTVIKSLGEGLIGGGGTFAIGVKFAWAIGFGAVLVHLFRSRVSNALGTALMMLAVTFLALLIILAPGQVIKYYTGITNELSNGVLSMAAGEDAEDTPQSTVTEGFLDEMWEAYVIVPFGYIQVSSDAAVASEYDEKALATSPDDDQRADALEQIIDETGVEDRASNSDWVMHLVWTLVTAVFGGIMALLLLLISLIVLVFQFIAIVALMTMPVWLLFAIIPAGGMPQKMLGWFLNLNVDVILAKLMLALFVAGNNAVLSANTAGEDMALIMRFLLSLAYGVGVIMLVFGVRGVLQASSFGRSGMLERGGLREKGGGIAAALAAGKGLAATAAGSVASGSPSSSEGGTGYKHPDVQRHDGLVNGSTGASMDKTEKQRNEADRAERGEEPYDNRSGKQRNKDRLGKGAGAVGGIAWKGTGAATGAAGAAGKIAGAAARRLPSAGLAAARSGFMPMNTAAALGGIGAASTAGAAYGLAGAGKNKTKQGAKGIVGRVRQWKQDQANSKRFSEDGEELAEKAAARMEDDDHRRDNAVEQDARNAYLADNPEFAPSESSSDGNDGPGGGRDGSADSTRDASGEDLYPEQPPQGTPSGASYDRQTGIITGDLGKDEHAPQAPEGYSGHTYSRPAEDGSGPQRRYAFTPNSDANGMRGQEYDRTEAQRRQSREEAYNNRPESEKKGALRPDADGNMIRDPASSAERARDAAEDRMRDEQRSGIVNSGFSSFGEFHKAKNQALADAAPTHRLSGESLQDFQNRQEEHSEKVKAYNPSHNPPPEGGERIGQDSASSSGGGFRRVYPSIEEIKNKDPEGFKQYYEPRAKQEFTGDEYKRMKEAKERRADPQRQRGSWDQTPYMEAARSQVKQGIRRGDSDGAIITGMNEPENGEGPQMTKFQDRIRQVNDSWIKNGPRP